MILDKKFENLLLNVSSKAALAAYSFVGKKDKMSADKEIASIPFIIPLL